MNRGREIQRAVDPILLLEKLENEQDLRDARASRAEAKLRGTIPWDQVKATHDLERSAHRMLQADGADEETAKKGADCRPPTPLMRGRPVRVEAGGRVIGILISEESFTLFCRLFDAEEDRLDVVAARAALREVGSVAIEGLADELGL